MDFLTTAEAAKLLRKTTRTLINWRAAGTGPDFVNIGRNIAYPRTALAAWLAASQRMPAR